MSQCRWRQCSDETKGSRRIDQGQCPRPRSRRQQCYPEVIKLAAVHKFHPRFANDPHEIWWDGTGTVPGIATLEGGDVMPLADLVSLFCKFRASPGSERHRLQDHVAGFKPHGQRHFPD